LFERRITVLYKEGFSAVRILFKQFSSLFKSFNVFLTVCERSGGYGLTRFGSFRTEQIRGRKFILLENNGCDRI